MAWTEVLVGILVAPAAASRLPRHQPSCAQPTMLTRHVCQAYHAYCAYTLYFTHQAYLAYHAYCAYHAYTPGLPYQTPGHHVHYVCQTTGIIRPINEMVAAHRLYTPATH